MEMHKNTQTKASVKNFLSNNYEYFNRFLSYFFQIELIEATRPKSILEIGCGGGTLGLLLKQRNYNYKSCDLNPKLKPNYIADIRKLPMKANSFDVVCAFEVLEHLPFSDFVSALKELKRVSKKYVIISIPYSCLYISFSLQFTFLTILKPLFNLLKIKPNTPIYFNLLIPTFFLRKYGLSKSHCWEMGRKGFSKSEIKKRIKESGLFLEKEFSRIHFAYNYFFVLRKSSRIK
jgi:ubiquinone/menaquinone biosynthesis C-methylase UbiE